jgi:hypothetical protein
VDHVCCARKGNIPQRQVQSRAVRVRLALCALLQSRVRAVPRANATLGSPVLTLGHANPAHLARTRARKARRLATTCAPKTQTPPWPALGSSTAPAMQGTRAQMEAFALLVLPAPIRRVAGAMSAHSVPTTWILT